MALVPAGATVLANPSGAAPGLVLESRTGRLCVLLPGIPREMKGIVSNALEEFLVGRFGTRLRGVVHQVIHTVGIPESALASQVEPVLPPFADRVSLAYLPDDLGVRLRLSARFRPDRSGAEEALREVEEALAPILSPYRYHAESGDLAEAVGAALVREGKTLAVAESCTGGLISKRVTDIPGSSRFFLGGIVAYANQVKAGLLNIDASLMEEEGVVSEAVAEALADGAIRALGADMGVGVTGVAGPGGGSPGKPVGTVCISVSGGAGTVSRKELLLGDRETVRARAAHHALGLLLKVLDGRSP
jgi:nicotinamide-nucleotide amidase